MKVYKIEAVTVGGDFAETTGPIRGILTQLLYVPASSEPLDTGSDLDIVGAKTGLVVVDEDSIGTAQFTRVPVQPGHDPDGTEAGTHYPFSLDEPLTLTIANGGNDKSGTFYLYVDS